MYWVLDFTAFLSRSMVTTVAPVYWAMRIGVAGSDPLPMTSTRSWGVTLARVASCWTTF